MDFTADALVALATLTALEIVLGIDNIVFIAILCGKLPPHQRDKARLIGLALAMFMRVGLLLSISWIMGLTQTLFTLPSFGLFEAHAASATQPHHNPLEISGRDLILILGGLFLVGKATYEIHDKLEAHEHGAAGTPRAAGFASVLVQILVLDLVFSLDSVITAVGMAKQLWVMIAAVVIAIGVMLAFSGAIVRFIDRHPTMKMLALSFLILIGIMLIAESFDVHIPKGYIYFAMAFSLLVEMLNIRLRKRGEPVHLKQGYVEPAAPKPEA